MTEKDLKETHRLFEQSSKFYQSEQLRVDGTSDSWHELLGVDIQKTSVLGTTTDGVVAISLSSQDRAFTCVVVWKQELGSRGDAGFQAACTYRKLVTEAVVRFVLKVF